MELRGSRRLQMFALLGVLALVVFHIWNNWVFVRTQVTLLGWDRPAHLVRTLIYNDMLQQVNPRSLFEVMTWSWNRPPLTHLAVVPFYRVFGVSTDVALMANGLFVVILLFSVYGIGYRLYNWRVGLLAAFLVSTYPILFSISRMPYVEYSVTALVALAIYLALTSEGFRRRRASLVLGLVIGLGVLTKWPFVAFAGAPIAYVAVASGALRDIARAFRSQQDTSAPWQRLWASPLFHVVSGLLLTLLWYWPNRDRLQDFALGYWLIPISWFLVTSALYALSRPAGQGANLLSALTVGLVIGSVWSLPNLRFSERFLTVVYSGLNMEGTGLGPANPAFYLRYLRYLPHEQLSPLYFVVLLVAVAVIVYRRWRRNGFRGLWRNVGKGGWVLGLWFGGAMLIFTFSQTMNSRFDVALLPALALISARGLLLIEAAWLRRGLVALVVVLGLAQFFALSYDGLGWVRERAVLSVPGGGRLSLLGEGSYIELPSSDRTDKSYAVGPLVLDFIAEDMVKDGRDSVQLGNLVNRSYSNNAILQYLMYDAYGEVELREFARSEWESPPYYERLFECDYLLMKSDPYPGLRDHAQEAMAIIDSSPSFFVETFQVLWEHALPDGDTVFLYKKRYHLAGEYDADDFRAAAGAIAGHEQEADGVVLVPGEQVEVLGRYYVGQLRPYPLSDGTLLSEEKTQGALAEAAAESERLFLVLWKEGQYDSQGYAEGWLVERGRQVWQWSSGDLRVFLYDLALSRD